MSKRSWLSTQKGTTLFPNVIRAPVKLVIRGVPARIPLYNAVADKFGGRLKQFHGKQQQAFSLHESNVHRGHIDWGNARATYTNINGQEILELEVDMSLLEEIQKELPEQPWDWAVVDIHVPIFTHHYFAGYDDYTESRFLAEMRSPASLEPEWLANSSSAAGGLAASNVQNIQEYSAETPPVMQWAGTSTRPYIGVRNGVLVEIHSILIDMRKFQTLEVMVFDLSGGLESMDDDSIPVKGPRAAYWIIQQHSTPADLEVGGVPTPETLTSSGVAPADPPANYVDNSEVPADYPSPFPQHGGGFVIDVPDPPISAVWGELIAVDEKLTVNIPQGQSFSIDVSHWEFHENILHYDFYPTYEPSYESTPVIPTAQAWCEGALFRGTPNWEWSDSTVISFVTAYQWEILGRFPDRFGTGRIGPSFSLPVTEFMSEETGVAGNWGLGHLGTLTVSPKHGWAVFSPA